MTLLCCYNITCSLLSHALVVFTCMRSNELFYSNQCLTVIEACFSTFLHELYIAYHNEIFNECSLWYGGNRPRWLGPIPFEYPSYLTGQLPGDYGFDLAALGKDAAALQKYYKYSSLHFL